ncbi:tetratricopeptide repeat protein [Larkinella sp.]|uniref:tetratricopeptide repeat protein n=1 Tax=Larkinella sp. TaxID=2034517 RepID=UPI003BAA6172
MELSEEVLEQIGLYLSDRMTPAEKAVFENRMRNDESLRQEVATQREIKQGLTFLAQKERFKTLHSDLEKRGLLKDEDLKPEADESHSAETPVIALPTGRTELRTNWSYFSAAASVLLLAGLSWALFRNWSDKQALMAQNEKSFEIYFSPIPKPQPVLPNDPDRVAAPVESAQTRSDSVRLTEAIDALKLNDTRLAISQLTSISQGKPDHWSATAHWYLALAYLKAQQREEARKVARQLADQNGHPYQEEARELFEHIQQHE